MNFLRTMYVCKNYFLSKFISKQKVYICLILYNQCVVNSCKGLFFICNLFYFDQKIIDVINYLIKRNQIVFDILLFFLYSKLLSCTYIIKNIILIHNSPGFWFYNDYVMFKTSVVAIHFKNWIMTHFPTDLIKIYNMYILQYNVLLSLL